MKLDIKSIRDRMDYIEAHADEGGTGSPANLQELVQTVRSLLPVDGGMVLRLSATQAEQLHQCGVMLACWGDDCFDPPNAQGQRAMGAIMMESAAAAIIALFYPLQELCQHRFDDQAGACRVCGMYIEDAAKSGQ